MVFGSQMAEKGENVWRKKVYLEFRGGIGH
jgi:hypothetical protein